MSYVEEVKDNEWYPYFPNGKRPTHLKCSKYEEVVEEHLTAKKECEDMFARYSLPSNHNPDEIVDPSFTRYVVVIGNTGAGKSLAINTILDRNVRSVSNRLDSETMFSAYATGTYKGMKIRVIDTPGVHNNKQSDSQVKEELTRAAFLMRNGVHCYIICINISNCRLSNEDVETLKLLKDFPLRHHCMVLFTNIEIQLKHRNLQEYMEIQKQKKDYRDFLSFIGDRVVAVNNASDIPAEIERNRKVMIEMVEKVIRLNKRNGRRIAFQDEFTKRADSVYKKMESVVGGNHPVLVDSMVEALIEYRFDVVRAMVPDAVVEYALKLVEKNSKIETTASGREYFVFENDERSHKIECASCKPKLVKMYKKAMEEFEELVASITKYINENGGIIALGSTVVGIVGVFALGINPVIPFALAIASFGGWALSFVLKK